MDLSKEVGFNIAEKMKKNKITKIVIFDRNGYLYHGRVKALLLRQLEKKVLKFKIIKGNHE